MGYETLVVTRAGKIATITLDRPEKRNALNTAMREEIDDCLAGLEEDDGVSVAVVLARGPAFCAGFDLSEFSGGAEKMRAVFESSSRYHRRVAEFCKPLIAGVHGPAMGGGFDLAVLCDIRIAAPEATFGHPEIKFGAQVLYAPLKEIVGGGPARDLALTGRKIDADEARRLGLVSRVVERDKLAEACAETAASIAEAPLATLKAMKRRIVRCAGGWDALETPGQPTAGA